MPELTTTSNTELGKCELDIRFYSVEYNVMPTAPLLPCNVMAEFAFLFTVKTGPAPPPLSLCVCDGGRPGAVLDPDTP